MMQKELNLDILKKYQDNVKNINLELSKFTRKKFDNVQNILSLNIDSSRLLSNFAKTPFCFENTFFKFDSVEQYYQYTKALFFNEKNLAGEILQSTDALLQKKLSKKIKSHYSLQRDWDKNKVQVMYLGLVEKFRDIKMQNLLLSTKNKVLTHLHPTLSLGSWEVDFPALLMYIRDNLMSNLKVGIFINTSTNDLDTTECLENIDNILHSYNNCEVYFEENYKFLQTYLENKNIKYKTVENQEDIISSCNEVVIYGIYETYLYNKFDSQHIKINSVIPNSQTSLGLYQQISRNKYKPLNYFQQYNTIIDFT